MVQKIKTDVSTAVSIVSQSRLIMLQYTAVRALDVTQLLPVRLVYDQEASKWRHAHSVLEVYKELN